MDEKQLEEMEKELAEMDTKLDAISNARKAAEPTAPELTSSSSVVLALQSIAVLISTQTAVRNADPANWEAVQIAIAGATKDITSLLLMNCDKKFAYSLKHISNFMTLFLAYKEHPEQGYNPYITLLKYANGLDENDTPSADLLKEAAEMKAIEEATPVYDENGKVLEYPNNMFGLLYQWTIDFINLREEEKPLITPKRLKAFIQPLDKINSTVWMPHLLTGKARDNSSGNIETYFDMSKRKGGKALVYCKINFDALDLPLELKKLTPFDRRLYNVAANICKEGNDYTTLTQLYTAMGYHSKPGAKDLPRIKASLEKLQSIVLTLIDDTSPKHPYQYGGSLLPIEWLDGLNINHKLTDSVIHFFRVPPLFDFACDHNQITTIPLKLLQSPVSKTENTLCIEDYLQTRIAHIKHGQNAKILFSTLYERCGIKTSKQKARAHETVIKLLDYYKSDECNHWIDGYKLTEKSITIFLPSTPAISGGKA